MTEDNWHAQEPEEVYEDLGTSEEGLSQEEAEERLEEHGRNEIKRGEDISPLKIFLSQFDDFLVYLLILAALVSLGVGLFPGHEPEYVDAALIFLILLGNGIFGFIQDYKAEKSIEALKDLSSPNATVMRDGEKKVIDSKDIVPGDIVFLEQGDAVPADARILEASSLEADESALTGESSQVSKVADTLDEDTPLAEREDMAYMNTNVVRGRGKAVVVGTGMETEVGDIATQLEEADQDETPFQQEVDSLGKQIGYGIIAIIILVGIFQFSLTSTGILPVLLVAISLAVAAVPEGLPAVVTLTLALGSKKMLEKNALVRRLPVVESLGSIDVIVSDKTGTLTEDLMTVTKVYANGKEYKVTGEAKGTEGKFKRNGGEVNVGELEPLLKCGKLCNNAEITEESDNGFIGDPTEMAVLVSANKAGIEAKEENVREIPFSSARKRMTVITEDDGYTAWMKGAPETVLERCDRIMIDGEVEELTDEKKEEIIEKNKKFAGEALRVLGMAYREVEDPDMEDDEVESDMVFLGLQGMIDPPREEVKEAVKDCRDAGIKVIMATGDNIETAKAVGGEIGFNPDGALTGEEIEEMSDEELEEKVEDVEVFARVSPSHKVRILDALKANGHRVAMTGDGVNDAPALKDSDVGISMGVRGTDVAQQASDMVLQDDNFVTIRDAIAEGRGIFDNIQKFVSYLLSYNAGEVLIVFFGILIGSLFYPDIFHSGNQALILTPVMLLWINLVTDGLPALALGADPKVEGIMNRKPRDKDHPVIDLKMACMIVGIGTLMTVTLLPVFFSFVQEMQLAQTLVFTGLVVFEMVGIQAIRKTYNTRVFSNKWLWVAILGSLILQAILIYTPLRQFFKVVPLDLSHLGWIAVSLAVFFVLVAGLVATRDYLMGETRK